MPSQFFAWTISALVFSGLIIRPFKWPEYVWALTGAVLLVLLGAVSPISALSAVAEGNDVYLFLIGMMLLSEAARIHGLFDYLDKQAVRHAAGSSTRLFVIIYAVGTMVTVFLSNDATAVVLTPAVYAAAKSAKVNPLPYLFICAFIANAASFVLPISNPANLLIYGAHMPTLGEWLARFLLPSILAIGVTFAVLFWTQKKALDAPQILDITPSLPTEGKIVAVGIAMTAAGLLVASALGVQLGLPTFALGSLVSLVILVTSRSSPWPLLKGVSWGVLPLVAGLFVVIEGLAHVGLLESIDASLRQLVDASSTMAPFLAGAVVAVTSNVINNLPMGLIVSSAAHAGDMPNRVIDAMVIGVDLGPNLSVTGSLATILWLVALRREGITVSSRQFLALGLLVMPLALIAALTAVALQP